jgi:competence protein ComEC
LYDAGPRFPSGFDTGSDVALPVLRQRPGVPLDLLVISHADNDHAGGAPSVLAAYPGASVLKGPDVAHLPGTTCVAGQRWHWDGVHFEVLHPREGFAPLGNESSCVLKVTTSGGSLLVLGDAERRAERELAAHPRVSADAVVVGHHGSATSSTPTLVRASRAHLALVSAGHRNRWNFPRPEVVERWEASGASVHSTGDAGALHLTLGEHGITLSSQRMRRKRYWAAR